MQVLEHESVELVDFDGEMSKNHRDRILNNEHTEGKREGTRGKPRALNHQKLAALRAVARIQFLTKGYDYYGRKKQSPRIISGAMDADGEAV